MTAGVGPTQSDRRGNETANRSNDTQVNMNCNESSTEFTANNAAQTSASCRTHTSSGRADYASAEGQEPARSTAPTTDGVYVHGVGPGDQYKVCETSSDPPFNAIREMCASDEVNPDIDTRPESFRTHRTRDWPTFEVGTDQPEDILKCKRIYDVVKETGLPNCMEARIPLDSSLNISVWERYADGSSDEAQLVEFIKYGFPLGYMGPPSDTAYVPNHASARNFPAQVSEFVNAEREKGALMGPFLASPFRPWAHVSPLMSRPKAGGDKRRIISDLTFPQEKSVNAYIQKNSALGEVRDHTLPTVADFVHDLKDVGVGAYMFTVDVARAYKNFRVDPLDWPLMCISWEDKVYIETAMPFGARSSSNNMQRAADMITRILEREGIRARMYLDDLIVVAESREVAHIQYERVRDLFHELGLPEAEDKVQPPATKVRWLGIDICSVSMSLSIPDDKLNQVREEVNRCRVKRTIHRKLYESLLGRLLHVAKCVVPARIFMSRMLQAYREAKSWFVRVTPEVRADLDWFAEFCAQWNGRAIIPPSDPSRSIQVDACLSGVGAADGERAYSGRITDAREGPFNITELETTNVIIALHTFLTEADRGSHVLVECDNLAAVQALKWGKARNPILAECSRMAWMVQAVLDITISFAHIAGVNNGVADALSRAHLSKAHLAKAENVVADHRLCLVDPCMHVLAVLHALVCDRPGIQLAGDGGRGEAARIQGSGDEGQPPGGGTTAGGFLHEVRHGSGEDVLRRRVLMDRVPGSNGGSTWDDQKPAITRASVRAAGWRRAGGAAAPACRPGARRGDKNQGSGVKSKRRHTSGNIQVCAAAPASHPGEASAEGGIHNNVPGDDETIGGGASLGEEIRPGSSLDSGRYSGHRQSRNHTEMGEELTKVQPKQADNHAANGRRGYVSSPGGVGRSQHTPRLSRRLPISVVPQDSTACIYHLSEKRVAGSCAQSGGRPKNVQPPQHSKGICNRGVRRRVYRAGGAASRRLVFGRSPHLYQYQKVHESPDSAGKNTEKIDI